MTVEKETIDGRMVCRLNGGLNIYEAGAIWKDLLPLLNSTDPLTLDFSEISECDSAGVQILCQIRQFIQKETKPIDIAPLSQPVKTAMQQAGLASIFTCPLEEI